MTEFFQSSVGLFSKVFDAAMGVEFFRFIGGCLVLALALAVFQMMYRGVPKG